MSKPKMKPKVVRAPECRDEYEGLDRENKRLRLENDRLLAIERKRYTDKNIQPGPSTSKQGRIQSNGNVNVEHPTGPSTSTTISPLTINLEESDDDILENVDTSHSSQSRSSNHISPGMTTLDPNISNISESVRETHHDLITNGSVERPTKFWIPLCRQQPDFLTQILDKDRTDSIWRNIAKYLPVADLKITRQTCTLLLAKVNNYQRFQDSLEITICKDICEERVLIPTTFKWKAAKVYVGTLPQKSIPPLKEIFKNVEYLHLDYDGITKDHDVPKFIEILQIVPKLTSLNLYYGVLQLKKMPFSLLQSCLGTLSSFAISGGKDNMVVEENGIFEHNLEEIASVNMELKNIDLSIYLGFMGKKVKLIGEAVMKILTSSSEILIRMKMPCYFDDCDSKSQHILKNISEIKFPSLREIDVYFGGEANAFIGFLEKQPLLETIHLLMENTPSKPGSSGQLDVLDAIKKRSSNLKGLYLNGSWKKVFPGGISWSFLSGLDKLKDFSVTGNIYESKFELPTRSNIDAQPCCLDHLPSNIEGIQVSQFRCAEKGSWESSILNCLERFVHLTSLDMETFKNALNDTILQSICKTLTKLQVLKFGDCNDITDFGLTGLDEQKHLNTQVSLKNLKGLRRLSILNCNKVTEGGLCSSIAFSELVFADLRSGTISDWTVVEIAARNPSLEQLMRYLDDRPDSFSLQDEFSKIMTVNKRLTRVKTRERPGHRRRRQPQSNSTSLKLDYRPSYGVLPYNSENQELFVFKSYKDDSDAYSLKI